MKILIALWMLFMVNAHATSADESNFNLALSSKNVKHCVLIKKKDKKKECFGIIKRDTGYCNMIEDKDLQHKCLSFALSDITHCDRIESKIIQASCRALFR